MSHLFMFVLPNLSAFVLERGPGIHFEATTHGYPLQGLAASNALCTNLALALALALQPLLCCLVMP
jgi:hypothetical protein